MGLCEDVERFLDEGGPLARRLPGYAPRAAQIDMAVEVARTLTEGGHLVVEAGTGTGKSLAYLAAALLSDLQVIVATGTKALQDQLMEKDLPVVLDALAELTGKKKRAALVKGRQNYLCKVRWERFAAEPRFVFYDDKGAYPALAKWAPVTTTGDRAEIEGFPDHWPTWQDLDAGSETCLGQRCARYQDCFVTDMRRRAADANLLVVNHHLLCADQRLRLEGLPASGEEADDARGASYAAVLPDAGAVIVDEAHALPDVATDYFGVNLSTARLDRLTRDLRRYAEALTGPGERLSLLGASEAAERALAGVFDELGPLATNDRVRLDKGRTPKDLDPRAKAAREALGSLAQRLESLAGDDDDVERAMSYRAAEGKALRRRTDQVWEELEFLLGKAREDPAFVAYVEPKKRGLALGAVPIDVAGALAKTLFSGDRPVVLTSATLAVAGSTLRFEERVGLRPPVESEDEAPPSPAHVLLSPFDHERQAALYAPQGMPEPDDEAFFARFCDEVRFLIELSRGGALLLFTSYRALERAYEELGPTCESLGLVALKQGEAPKARLLEALRERSGDDGAVLFATASFWEGVDVPGRALRVVVIDRLPFRAPTDPVQQARAELHRARGRDPFQELSLPEAALLLKQGAGRLLRTHEDAGVVAVLDGRLRRRRYGRIFLDTLPPMTRIGSRKALSSFWRRFVAPVLGLPAGADDEASAPQEEPAGA